jgi:hypothetical protein
MLFLYLIKHNDLNRYGRTEAYIHAFLTFSLGEPRSERDAPAACPTSPSPPPPRNELQEYPLGRSKSYTTSKKKRAKTKLSVPECKRKIRKIIVTIQSKVKIKVFYKL